MATRKIIDAKQNGEKVWLKGHAQATYMSDGLSVEDAIKSMQTGSGGITFETDPIFSASPAFNITDGNIENWNGKQDAISDLDDIRRGASKGDNSGVFVKFNELFAEGTLTTNESDVFNVVKTAMESNTPLLLCDSNYSIILVSHYPLKVGNTIIASGTLSLDVYNFTFASGSNQITVTELKIASLSNIPTTTSQLTNDSGFITINDVDIPTKTSDLINDSGFITINDVPEVEVPTKTSDLTNDSGFVTSADNIASATKLQTTRYINGVGFDGTRDICNYAVCGTSASTATKVVTVNSDFDLQSGAKVTVKFNFPNTNSSPKLNVNSTGGRTMRYKGTNISNSFIFDGEALYTFTYNGTYWVLEGDWDSYKKQDELVSGTNIKTINGSSILGSGNITIEGGGNTVDTSSFATKETVMTDEIAVNADGLTTTDGKWFALPGTDSENNSDFCIATFDDIPTKTSDLINDSGFITSANIPEVTVPTKTSDLTNDSGFITSDGTVAKADQLTTTRFINGVPFNGTTNVNNFVSCSTAAATAAKTVTIDGFRLLSGAQVRVKFTNANTASSPTLNVSSTGAKPIYYNGLYSTSFTNTSFPFDADKIYTFTYNGTYWVLEGDWLNTVTATSTSANYPLILGPSASAGATITSGDKMLYTDSVNSLYYNPNTNILFAPNLQVTTNLKFPAPSTTYPSANIGMGAKPTGTYNGLVLYNAGGSNSDKDFVNIIGETHVWNTDGSIGTVFANISGNAASATALETPITINRMTFDGSANVSNYVVCSTKANTIPKVINVPNMTLGPDARIWIEFTNGNTYLGSLAASVTHINGTTQTFLNFYGCTGQQPTGSGNTIHYKSIVIPAGVYEFVYYNSSLCFTGNYVSEKKPYIVVGSSVASANTPTIALNHTLHTVVNLSNPRALTFTVSDSSMVHDYSFEFRSGTIKPTVTFPSAWKWANGTAPTISANKTYHVSVVNNCAVIAEF